MVQKLMVKLGAIQKYPYRKINGVKYYVDVDNNVFSVLNDNKESLLNAKDKQNYK